MEIPVPWSAEALAACPKDEFRLPVTQKGFLHYTVGNGDKLVDGGNNFYQFDLYRFLRDQTDEVQQRAKDLQTDLIASIAQHSDATRQLEGELWRIRYEDYHRAIEAGDYVVVDWTGLTEEAGSKVLAGKLEEMHLGELNRDFVYVVSSTRPGDNRSPMEGRFSAIIYLTRSRFPRSFELMDEIARIRDAAEDVVRTRLGITR